MSTELFIKGFFAAIISSILSWIVFARYDSEIGTETEWDSRPRYLPYLPALLLPILIGVLFLMALPKYGLKPTLEMVLSLCFGIFLHISVYYLILMLAMPLLRKIISARARAMLWILPNYLYFTVQSFMAVPEPLYVVRIESGTLWIILWLWLAGFSAVLLWKLAEHIRFRHRILKDAKPVTNPEILSVWNSELENARITKPKYRLVISPTIRTPLSIGFFPRTTRVILPDRHYSQEDLALIFRHELIHICREDSSNKFFLVFCTAMCWFNPLMWTAMRRSADDLELSCDETVLLEAEPITRRKYADLILCTAGEEQGFTTCLSASAAALRYRLKHIVKPRKLRSGAIIVGLCFFLLCMSCGYVALAYDASTGQEVIFGSSAPASYEVSSVNYAAEDGSYFLNCPSDAALSAYLADLSVSRLTGNFSFTGSSRRLVIIYHGPDGAFGVTLRDRMLSVTPLHETESRQVDYYISTPVDWEYLLSLLNHT